MRIGGPRRPDQISSKKSAKAPSQASGFSLSASQNVTSTSGASGPQALAPIDALVGIQEVKAGGGRRKKAIRRAEKMLDILDDIKLGFLAGRVSVGKLSQLRSEVESQRESVDEPELTDILDAIDLRAQVELAKLGRAAA